MVGYNLLIFRYQHLPRPMVFVHAPKLPTCTQHFVDSSIVAIINYLIYMQFIIHFLFLFTDLLSNFLLFLKISLILTSIVYFLAHIRQCRLYLYSSLLLISSIKLCYLLIPGSLSQFTFLTIFYTIDIHNLKLHPMLSTKTRILSFAYLNPKQENNFTELQLLR